MLFNKERISFKKIIATTLLFSFCNLSTSIADAVVAEDVLQETTLVNTSSVRLNNGTVITDSQAKINLSLRDSDVKQVLRMFAHKAGLNIIFHSSVNGKVTLDLVDTNVNDAFELVLEVKQMNIYFGENLKNYRLKRNLTQEKLAEFLGVSFQTISKWENGVVFPDITASGGIIMIL